MLLDYLNNRNGEVQYENLLCISNVLSVINRSLVLIFFQKEGFFCFCSRNTE